MGFYLGGRPFPVVPRITILTPDDGATVSGAVEVRAQVSNMPASLDNVSIFFGSLAIAVAQGGGVYAFTFDTVPMLNGNNDIVASARPSVGSPIATQTITVNVNNAPPG